MDLKLIFKYVPTGEYNFSIPVSKINSSEQNKNSQSKKNIYTSIEQNSKYMKSEYNQIINSDIVFYNEEEVVLVFTCVILLKGMRAPNLRG